MYATPIVSLFYLTVSFVTSCRFAYRTNLSTQPTAHACSRIAAGSDKGYLSDKIRDRYILNCSTFQRAAINSVYQIFTLFIPCT